MPVITQVTHLLVYRQCEGGGGGGGEWVGGRGGAGLPLQRFVNKQVPHPLPYTRIHFGSLLNFSPVLLTHAG